MKRQLRFTMWTSVAALCSAAGAFAQPANDDCVNAVVVPAGALPYLSPTYDISSASNITAGDPTFVCHADVSRTIWFTFTPTAGGMYTFSTCAADAPGTTVADTTVAVFTGDCVGGFSSVGCDDTGCGTRATVSKTLVGGTQYYIVVGRSGSDDPLPPGDDVLQLHVSSAAGGFNDECADATVIPPTTTAYVSAAVDLATATMTTDAPNVTCTTNISHTLWWKFSPSNTGNYTFGTCAAVAPLNTVGDTYLGVYRGTDCGSLTQVACNDDNCDGLHSSLTVLLISGNTYFIKGAKYGVGEPLTGESNFQFAITNFVSTLPPPPPVCTVPEVEPNNSKAEANAATLAHGQGVCGFSAGEADYFKIKTAPMPGIVRNRLNVTTTGTAPVVAIRSMTQAAGVINTASDAAFQTAGTFVQWFTLGTTADANDRSIYVSATNGAGNYTMTMEISPVTPDEVAGGSLEPGSITIETVGTTTPGQTDTDIWVYDGNFNAIPEFGNDDEPLGATLGSRLVRTYAAGTYYLALGQYSTGNNMAAAPDDDFQLGNVLDFPGVIARSVPNQAVVNVNFRITDSVGSRNVPGTLDEINAVRFFKFVVGSAAIVGCQPADIADDQGTPLNDPNRNPAVPNSGVNEGDYNCFFGGFFDAQTYCDQWDDQGTALNDPNRNPAVPNSGVNEGDYNGFFATFFNGCP